MFYTYTSSQLAGQTESPSNVIEPALYREIDLNLGMMSRFVSGKVAWYEPEASFKGRIRYKLYSLLVKLFHFSNVNAAVWLGGLLVYYQPLLFNTPFFLFLLVYIDDVTR